MSMNKKTNGNVPKKRNDMNENQKRELIAKFSKHPGASQRFLAKTFGISVGFVNSLIRNKEIITASPETKHAHNKRKPCLKKTESFDDAVYVWIQNQRKRNISLTGEIIKQSALKFAEAFGTIDFKASNGWLESFLKRHNISSRKIVGESGLVDMNAISNFKETYCSTISRYAEEDIFNCDESGLFFKASYNRTYTCSDENMISGKFSKERITILFCASKSGEKLPLLIIGKSKNPRCFRNAGIDKFPLTYRNNNKSWMTLKIFGDWLNGINYRMKSLNRKILLLLDNAPVHPIDVEFTNIELLYLPPNTTSKTQPLDQGVIKSFKDKYRRQLSNWVNFEIDSDQNLTNCQIIAKITMYNAIKWSMVAWNDINEDCVKNCWKLAEEQIKNCRILDVSHDENEDLFMHDNFPTFENLLVNEETTLQKIVERIKDENMDGDDESDVCKIEDKRELITQKEAMDAIELLETWYTENLPTKILSVWNIQKELSEEKHGRNPKITDFMRKL